MILRTLKKNKTPLYLIPYINALNSKDFSDIKNDNLFSLGGDLKIAIGTD